jgi:tetratricopeptide (TPR) repeat protein
MSRSFNTAEVARILRTPQERVRSLVRAGLCRPARRGRSYEFSFQDLVVLRAASGLLEQEVPAVRVRRALGALAEQLPEGRPLSGLRIFADGGRVAVREGGASWHPETGQTLLEFDVAELAERVKETLAAPDLSRDPLRARREFERALTQEPRDPEAACEAYRRALEFDPDLVEAYVNLGRLEHEAGDVKEAARLYHLALERSPEDPVIHFNLAVALEDCEGTTPAVSHYERALRLDPGFADAHFNLAGLYEKLGRASDALRHYLEYKKLTS